ncbi:MAG: hypothetical protein WCK91_00050 [bacterium]
MADKPKPKPSFLEEHFGLSVTLFILIIFTIWVLTGGPNPGTKNKNNFLSSPTPEDTYKAGSYKY